MPTYEYKCEACGHKFEKFQSIMAKPIRKCPTCGKNKVKRLIGTGAGLIFKGGGFYITDYRSDSYKNAAKADSGGGGSSEGAGAKEGSGGKEASGAKESSSGSNDSGTKAATAESKPAAKPAAEAKPAGEAKSGAGKSSKSSK